MALSVNTHTVLKAFDMLQRCWGKCSDRRGMGYFLTDARRRVDELRRNEFYTRLCPRTCIPRPRASSGITIDDLTGTSPASSPGRL